MFKQIKQPLLAFGLTAILALPVYTANAKYLSLNRLWLRQANEDFQKNSPDFQSLVGKIKELPLGRVYAGSPGNWGRDFKIGSTQVYLALSTTGLSLNGFLPESWSLNTDPEMFFDYTDQNSYQLFNVRYLVTPTDFEAPKFAREIATYGNFKLSQITTDGYFDIVTSNLFVSSTKKNFLNPVHLWLMSDLPLKKEFPTLDLTGNKTDLPYNAIIKVKDGFFPQLLDYPQNEQPAPLGKIVSESVSGSQKLSAKIEVSPDCKNCLAIFKMTYHPNWKALVDNNPVEDILMVFPSYTAIRLGPGVHEVIFEYHSSWPKTLLMLPGLIGLLCLLRQKISLRK